MSKDMVIAVTFKSTATDAEIFVQDIRCTAKDTDWTLSKGIDGVTIILGMVATSVTAALSKTLIKYIERKDSIIVELTIDKKKYKFKGMDQEEVLAIIRTIGVKHDGA
jgi:predicted peroxiredoxin